MKKTAPHRTYSDVCEEAKMIEARDGIATSVASFEIVKVVREFVPVKADVFGNTFGELLDAQLREAAESGQEVQDITLHIEQDMWNKYAGTLCGKAQA